MQKVIIKHISGSKANQTEIFELPIDVITFGRDASCQVAYDPLKDDLVSRIHLKITLNEGNQFLLTDLNSSNGTFVNEQKITKPVTLQAGDIVQLGKDGAKFEFDLDPRPTLAPKATRLQESIPLPKPTRENVISQTAESLYSEADTQNMGTEQKRSVGRETVERMIAQVESEAQSKIAEAKSDTRRKMINISAGIFTVTVLVAGYLVYHSSITTEQLENNIAASKEEQARKIAEIKSSAVMSAAEISKNYGPATVLIETSWKLRDVQSGQQLYQMQFCENIDFKRKKKCDSNDAYPAYVYFKEGEREYVEPILVAENEEDTLSGVTTYEKRLPIGGSGTGSGFVVDENGFILTNSHVAAGWETPFDIKRLKLPGLIYCANEGNDCKKGGRSRIDKNNLDPYYKLLSNWIPSNTMSLGGRPQQGKYVDGFHDYLEVTFPKTDQRKRAYLSRVSGKEDVALIKIDAIDSLSTVKIGEKDEVSAGDQITVMGYPSISPNRVSERLNRSIPEPTVSPGNIGKVLGLKRDEIDNYLRKRYKDRGLEEDLTRYQLTISSETGPGNSGGPVFNDEGRVIGIFSYMIIDEQGTRISFALPIKYGLEIMKN